MTENKPSQPSQIVPPSQISSATVNVISAQDIAPKVEVQEEEPYTIKCICDYSDDDGDTIFCDKCETWQHIRCFYPDNSEDAYRDEFSHLCADCNPRQLDGQAATERQRKRRELVAAASAANPSLVVLDAESADKKAKRLPTKSHKKKPKPTDLQLNGHASVAHEPNTKHASPSDHANLPPPKKPKTSHKPTPSMSSQSAAKRSPSIRTGPNGHPPSPATTPPDLPNDLEIQAYSNGFRPIHNEPTPPMVQVNSWASISVTNSLSVWLMDPAKMQTETGHRGDVFLPLPPNAESMQPLVRVHDKTNPPFLTSTAAIERDAPLLQLNGRIGVQRDYCADPENRWEQLSSPLPFVFFHPQLPIYIDTRREGSSGRFVRRSCKPNAGLGTYISTRSLTRSPSDVHFWLVSDRRIAENEQITIPWDFRLPTPRVHRLLGLGDYESSAQDEPDMEEKEYNNIAPWLHAVLSEYGGCACDLGHDCAFARFQRSYYAKLQARNAAAAAKKKSRKPKNHTISPTSTGQATNSRAPSEGRIDEAETDGRSVSESSRSKPGSRDVTPVRQGSFDQPVILTAPTDRDKKKIAMIENSFHLLEQQQAPPRKKKRGSDGNTMTSSATTATKVKTTQRNGTTPTVSLPNGSSYVDASTSRRGSVSPSTAMSPSTAHAATQPTSRQGSVIAPSRLPSVAPARASYRDASVQTDQVEGEWYSPPCPAPRPRKRVVSLSKRLLDSRYRLRQDEETTKQFFFDGRAGIFSLAPRMDVDSIGGADMDAAQQHQLLMMAPLTSPGGASVSGDVHMADAPMISPIGSATADSASISGVSPTLMTTPGGGARTIKAAGLQVQMPPVPNFSATSPTASTTTTPLSATASMVQSPFPGTPGGLVVMSPFAPPAVNGIASHPSPVKKKLSLSDYKSRHSKSSTAAAAAAAAAVSSLSARTMASSGGGKPTSPNDVAGSDAGGAVLESPGAERSDQAAVVTANGSL